MTHGPRCRRPSGQAAVQRCQWHKRENVVGYLPKGEQGMWRGRLQRVYERPTYAEVHSALGLLLVELEDRNQFAAASLAEGLEETLTSHRLGVYGVLGASFKTMNCIDSIEERSAKIDAWKNSNQRHRWLRAPRHRAEIAARQGLSKLRGALQRELNNETTEAKIQHAA
jgi:putative transposase